MTRATLRLFALSFVYTLSLAPPADAQGLSNAILAVPSNNVVDGRRHIEGRLYGGSITATISDRDPIPDAFNLSDVDFIRLSIRPRSGDGPTLVFPGGDTEALEDWARANATALLGILFPSSLSSSVLGRSAGEMQAQEVLLTTALATEHVREMSQSGRSLAGGMIEYETFTRDGQLSGDSTRAWQGLYNVTKRVSLQARFVQQNEEFATNATAFSVDYHPYVEINGPVRWRIGGSARTGFLFSRSNAMDLGSLEFGGGAFVSAFKNLGRVRLGGGTILQGSKSYIPPVFGDEGLAFLADAINERKIQYDLSYGGTAGVDTSSKTTVIVKVLQNRAIASEVARPDSWLVLSGLSYRFGVPSVNVGHKYYSTAGLHSHSVFAQGNFNW